MLSLRTDHPLRRLSDYLSGQQPILSPIPRDSAQPPVALCATGGSVIYASRRTDPAARPFPSHHDDADEPRAAEFDPLTGQIPVTVRATGRDRRAPLLSGSAAQMEGESAPVHGTAQDDSPSRARYVALPFSESSNLGRESQITRPEDARREALAASEGAATRALEAASRAPTQAASRAPSAATRAPSLAATRAPLLAATRAPLAASRAPPDSRRDAHSAAEEAALIVPVAAIAAPRLRYAPTLAAIAAPWLRYAPIPAAYSAPPAAAYSAPVAAYSAPPTRSLERGMPAHEQMPCVEREEPRAEREEPRVEREEPRVQREVAGSFERRLFTDGGEFDAGTQHDAINRERAMPADEQMPCREHDEVVYALARRPLPPATRADHAQAGYTPDYHPGVWDMDMFPDALAPTSILRDAWNRFVRHAVRLPLMSYWVIQPACVIPADERMHPACNETACVRTPSPPLSDTVVARAACNDPQGSARATARAMPADERMPRPVCDETACASTPSPPLLDTGSEDEFPLSEDAEIVSESDGVEELSEEQSEVSGDEVVETQLEGESEPEDELSHEDMSEEEEDVDNSELGGESEIEEELSDEEYLSQDKEHFPDDYDEEESFISGEEEQVDFNEGDGQSEGRNTHW
ncbi:hypothetical protein EXIGLDRAFT_842491 [Exidia glandulosa HHB12029]|uniref:Uncharacterized protein n=1 Tax=Exidia glandulosa HHB12029 TaxID=1314781 RepID=A0A165D9J7_EXIGL|nr:hypothetical protein EXIGLDRAFT_842491 [Exidia glandulosa HHB12029]